MRAALAAAWAAACVLLAWPTSTPAAEFLEAEKAFPVSVSRRDGETLEVHLQAAPGYLLYRDRLQFEVPAGGVALHPVLPPGQVKYDENFQTEVETYRGTTVVPVRVQGQGQAQGGAHTFDLQVIRQGCADEGLCYAPLSQTFRVNMTDGRLSAVADAPAAVGPLDAPPPAASSQVDAALRSGNLLVIAGVFMLAGLLLSFTPCVLPMVPILSSIIVGQAGPTSRARGAALAASYCLGMAIVYTAFGVVAGLLGEGLGAALQNPWVLGAFALVLAGLSLSMFGVYELQMPSALQNRVTAASGRFRGGHFAGVFAMGGLSALIVGPCVAAPLAGALVYISRTHDVVIGAVALFSLACGMSVPLMLVGLSAGSLLPRAGAWMERVKHVFGLMLLVVALWLVSPVLPAWALMALIGAMLLVCAAYLGAFERVADGATGAARLVKGAAVVLALVGSAQFIGVLSGGRSALQPLAHLASRGGPGANATPAVTAGTLPFRSIRTVAELDAAVTDSAKPVLVDFYADWCVSCKEYEAFTFTDPAVRDQMQAFTLLKVDVTANSADDKALMKRFDLFGPPGFVFFDTTGREKPAARVVGYQPGSQFLSSLKAAL